MEFIRDYMLDAESRAMLNTLCASTFGFDFENWFAGGFCKPGRYVPYSFVEGGKMLSNVSANPASFALKGKTISCVQIGTVMTAAGSRRQGLAARLMAKLIEDYAALSPDIYLFANDSAVGFYEKLGFVRDVQYRRYMPRVGIKKPSFAPAGRERFADYEDTCRDLADNSAFPMRDGFNLIMFYTQNMEDLYYSEELDCYALYDISHGELSLSAIMAKKEIPLSDVIAAIPGDFFTVKLGFTPRAEDERLFETRRYCAPDTNFMHLEGGMSFIGEERLFFPVLSHT